MDILEQIFKNDPSELKAIVYVAKNVTDLQSLSSFIQEGFKNIYLKRSSWRRWYKMVDGDPVKAANMLMDYVNHLNEEDDEENL